MIRIVKATGLSVSLCCFALCGSATAQQQQIEGWGQVVDPLGDCRVQQQDGTVSITVPGTYHDLHHGMDAPRILQDVDGDFTVQVRVRKFERPAAQSAANPQNPVSYVSGGILVWQSDRAFIRFQRAANGDTKFVGTFANYLADGKHIANSRIELPDEDVSLRIERKQSNFTLALSTDGRTWREVKPAGTDLPLEGRVKVGVFAINATTRTFKPEFTDYRLTRKP